MQAAGHPSRVLNHGRPWAAPMLRLQHCALWRACHCGTQPSSFPAPIEAPSERMCPHTPCLHLSAHGGAALLSAPPRGKDELDAQWWQSLAAAAARALRLLGSWGLSSPPTRLCCGGAAVGCVHVRRSPHPHGRTTALRHAAVTHASVHPSRAVPISDAWTSACPFL